MVRAFHPILDQPHARVDQLAGRGATFAQVVHASEPLLHPVEMGHRIGFGLTFGKLWAETHPEGRRVLLVPCGKGGIGFQPASGHTWNRHDTRTPFNLYRFAVAQIEAALATGANNRVVGFLWHQGETDTEPGARDLLHRTARRAHRRPPRTAFVPGPLGCYNSEVDTIHYNAVGQRELGRRYFAAAQRLLTG